MQPVYSNQPAAGALSDRVVFLRTTYLHLAVAILAFTLLSGLLYAMGIGVLMLQFMGASSVAWLAFMGVFMVAGWFATNMAEGENSSNGMQQLGLGLYVLAETLIFAPLFAIAEFVAPGAIPAAALITLLLCAGLTWTAFTSKTDFSFLGGILKVAGLAALGAIIASVIFGFALGIWFSALMIVFAGGCVLFDTSRIIREYPTNRPAGAALHLFASIALMFWYVLRLLIQLSGRD